MPTTPGTWSAGGFRVIAALLFGAATIVAAILLQQRMAKGKTKALAMLAVLIAGFFVFRWIFDAGVEAIEDIDAASTGYLGGLGLPILIAWPSAACLRRVRLG